VTEGDTYDRRAARRHLARLILSVSPVIFGTWTLQMFLKDIYARAGHPVVTQEMMVGLAFGGMAVGRLLAPWTIRWLGDRGSMLAGAFAYIVFAAAQWPAVHGWWLAPIAVGLGLCASCLWSVVGATTLDLGRRAGVGGRAGIQFGLNTYAQALGILVVGLIVSTGRINLAVLVGVMCAVATTAALWRFPTTTVRRDRVRPTHVRAFATDPHMILVGVFLMVGSLPFGLVFGAFRDHVRAHAPVWLVIPCVFLARGTVAIVGGALVDRLGRGVTLAAGFAVGAAALFLAPGMSETAGLIVSAVMLGVQMSLVPVAGLALVGATTASGHRPAALGLLFFWRDVGLVAGVLGGSYLNDALGAGGRGFAVFGAVMALFALLSLLLMRRRAERPAMAEEPEP